MEFEGFLRSLMERLDFPAEGAAAIMSACAAVGADPEARKEFLDRRRAYLDDAWCLGRQLDALGPMAARLGLPLETLQMALSMAGADVLHERYRARGISDEIFYRGMNDFRCKLVECRNVRGVWGTFVGGWFDGWYALGRFALGRFQYEEGRFPLDEPFTAGGRTLKKGDWMLNFHIPSDGVPLTREVRYDSYRRAYAFYREKFAGWLPLGCDSWLLYPIHYKILPEKMNIIGFMDDFRILTSHETPRLEASWRIFNADYRKPFAELPEDTALRRAYKKQLMENGTAGSGRGAFFFDGERIINK